MIVVEREILEVETVGEEAGREAGDPVVVQGQRGQGGEGGEQVLRQADQLVLGQHEDVQVPAADGRIVYILYTP